MEEPIQSDNVTFTFKKKYLAIIALAVIALLAFFFFPGLMPNEQPGGVPESQVPVNYKPPEDIPVGTAPHMSVSALSTGEEAVQGKIYFYWNSDQIAANGKLKVQIIAMKNELYSKEFNLTEHDFNFNESTVTRASTEKGYQEIIEETITDIFFDLRIPFEEIKKGTSSSADISIEFVSSDGGQRSWLGSLKDIPRDPAKFEGSPDDLRGPSVLAEKIGELINYSGFISLTEKGIFVSSPGELVISGENIDGEKIFNKSIQVQPGDFSFEGTNHSFYSASENKNLKYLFEFSSSEIKEGECIHKIIASFTPGNSQALEGYTFKTGKCIVNCTLSKLCSK